MRPELLTVRLDGGCYNFRQDEGTSPKVNFKREKTPGWYAEIASILQQVLQNGADFSRWVVAPVKGQGGVTLSYVCPQGVRFPLEDHIFVGLAGARCQQQEQ